MNYDNIWRYGANFSPSSAINQLEMWQADSFDVESIDRELGYAENIGMGIMRVFLHDLAFEHDRSGFQARLDKYLELASRHGIRTIFVFFDDCWKTHFSIGKQPAPIPYTHNSGWIQSPGNSVSDDLSERPRLENYVKTVMERFGHDERVLIWDLYNEPGNGSRLNKSLPLLRDVFRWAREVNPMQPLTSGLWDFAPEFDEICKFQSENSDLISFHCYDNKEKMQKRIDFMIRIAAGRPMLCSEYMARTAGSTFKEILPLLYKSGITAVNWGLVSGKTQTYFPWGWSMEKGEPALPFHDIFHKDGSFLCPDESRVFDEFKKQKHV